MNQTRKFIYQLVNNPIVAELVVFRGGDESVVFDTVKSTRVLNIVSELLLEPDLIHHFVERHIVLNLRG